MTNPDPLPLFRLCRFEEFAAGIRHVRETVFVGEQQVPLALEWDGRDTGAIHAVALLPGDAVIATARLLMEAAQGHIGRMAVLAPWRRRGIASALLRLLCDHAAQQACRRICLNAQLSAVPFYLRHGFVAEGPVFDDAGIPHRRMCRPARLD